MSLSFKTILRHLWRQRLFTTLNIVGLAIGISACWIIYGIWNYENSYEAELPDRSNTYRLVTGFVFDEKESYNGGVSAPLYQEIRKQLPMVRAVVPVYGMWMNTVKTNRSDGRQPYEQDEPKNIVATDSSYFRMVSYKWLAGNEANAFKDPGNVVLTESRARLYFPGESAADLIGKTVTYNDTILKTVAGIVKDLNYPSEFTGQDFFVLKPTEYGLNTWTNTNGSDKVYLQVMPGADTSKVLAQITDITSKKWQEFEKSTNPGFKFMRWFELLHVKDSHFSTYIKEYDTRKASKPVLYGLLGLGGFLLLLACINYINLTTAQIPQRRKEIGVRKTLGSGKGHLISQILMETFVTVVIAAVLAFVLAKAGWNLLADIIPVGAESYSGNYSVLLFVVLLVLIVSGLSGAYPAWLISRVQPIAIMRNNSAVQGKTTGLSPRKTLIVLQFVIAQLFIVSALIMGSQLSYTLKKDLGFNKDAVVILDIPWKFMNEKTSGSKRFALANEIEKVPGVKMLSLGRAPLTAAFSSGLFTYQPEGDKEAVKRQVARKDVDTNFVHLYEIKLLAGRNLRASDTTNEFVINETAVKGFGFESPQAALGKMIGQPGEMFPVVGVVKDFHVQNFHTTIEPVALMANKGNLSTLNIKLAGNNAAEWQKTLASIESKWNQFYPPGTFNMKFYDDTVKMMYEEERNMSTMINLATVISIVISCLGLFGLATLTAFQRTKEIGIRKVLGASVTGIVRLLSTDFIQLVIIALVIASPIAWWAMEKWLQDYVYRIEVQWWMFALAGAFAVIIAILTVSYQAIRAAVANPVSSLRSE